MTRRQRGSRTLSDQRLIATGYLSGYAQRPKVREPELA